jgi:hypothetical protein
MRSTWFRSDLIGVWATVIAFVAFLIASGIFFAAGPVAAIIASLILWGGLLWFVVRAGSPGPDLADIGRAPEGHLHRVLVVANQGLEGPAVYDEMARRSKLASLDVRILAPVGAGGLGGLTGDTDAASRRAAERVNAAVDKLGERGVQASGRIDEAADPVRALLDGLRERPANEVVICPGDEQDWSEAGSLAQRVREEVGVPVTELGGTRR